MTKVVAPQLGINSFNCPHCGAFTHHDWFKVLLQAIGKNERPALVKHDDALLQGQARNLHDERKRKLVSEFLERLHKNSITYRVLDQSNFTTTQMANLWLTCCFTCKGFSVWAEDKIVYPLKNSELVAHDEMPGDVRDDFNEAALIVDQSPRGAAALLRLAIQKLMPHLKQKGKDLNADIGTLVKKGLGADLAKAMDVLRVIGNNAVHPGQIDLKDDKAIALKLFETLNLIIERLISMPNRVEALFQGLPKGALKQIEQRDKKGSEEP